ncbi:MAG: hypothetical protein Q9183_005774, partial [Haloplaca sp. 2 TL-2023]
PLGHTDNLSNITTHLGAIPPEFQVVRDTQLPIRLPAEACFLNIIAAIGSIALEDFAGKTAPASYRTTRFPQPLIRINSPGLVDVERRFVVWGLFLVAYYINRYDAFNISFFSLQWKGQEVAGIGIAGSPRAPGQRLALEMPASNDEVKVDFAFFGGPLDLGKGSVFMTIIASILEAAPQEKESTIYQTVINYLNDESAIFIVTPTKIAKSPTGPHLTNKVLLDILARAAEFYAMSNIYRQLELNISVDGVMVAQGALVQRRNLFFLPFLNVTDTQAQELSLG